MPTGLNMSPKCDDDDLGLPTKEAEEDFEEDLYDYDYDDDLEESELLDETDEETPQETESEEDDLDSEVDDDSIELTDIEDFGELESLDPERDYRLLRVSFPHQEEPDPFDFSAFSDALDDLDPDEFDPSARRVKPFEVDVDGGLSREDRASQIAEELGRRYGWSEDGIQVLAETFTKHGWSASRVAIEREILMGLTPDELRIALDIRDFWRENVDFAMSFSGFGNQTDWKYISHRFWSMSWPCAFSLIRAFDSYPVAEEVEQLLLDLHERWKSRSCLRYRFPFFHHFVISYAAEVGRTPGLQAGWWPLDDLVADEDGFPYSSPLSFEE